MTDADAAPVLAAKEVCLNLLWQARQSGGWRRRFLQLYGQVLDAEDLGRLGQLWKEIRRWQRRIPRRFSSTTSAGSK